MDNYEATIGRVMVAFVDERGDLLQEALLTTVPRVGEEVELIIMPKLDPASIPTPSLFKAIKMMIWGDKEFEKKIEKSVEGIELPARVGTVLRVRWTPFVASPERALTAATVVLKLIRRRF